MNILNHNNFKCSVSSVLNKDVKQYGKDFMFDSKEDTSWSSDEGVPQWISVSFAEPQELNAFCIQFQGGFVGKEATVFIYSHDSQLIHQEAFYPEDINSPQNFKLKEFMSTKSCVKIKFVFNSSTDFFGRIIIYDLQIF